MDVARLQQLLDSALSRREAVEVIEGGRAIRIEPGATVSTVERRMPAQGTAVVAAGPDTIEAPCFGIVHLTPAPAAAPFVRVGDAISAGARVCLVEAMKVFHPVTAGASGRVAEILVASGSDVERGQPLMRLEIADDGV